MTVGVLLADGQPLPRAAFRGVIGPAADLEVIGEVSMGQQAVEVAW